MSDSTETLRRAAALMRERAEAARFFWSEMHPKAGQECPWHTEAELRMDFDEDQGPHIASWHPAVALAVADWLERLHDFLTSGEYDRDEELDAALAGEEFAPPLTDWPEVESALAVARTYLGESA